MAKDTPHGEPKQCLGCKFYGNTDSVCRRNAPRNGWPHPWPQVHETDWCGQYVWSPIWDKAALAPGEKL